MDPGLLIDDPEDRAIPADAGRPGAPAPAAPPTLVLAHGAGAPMDSPFMSTIARGVTAHGIRVVRFEFPYMRARRAPVTGPARPTAGARRPPDREDVLRATWEAVIATQGGGTGLVIGGKSLGGRIASMVADQCGARGLVCLGYPFHPPGTPARLRVAHLARLRTAALIVQGTRDPFGSAAEVPGYRLAASIRVHWIPDGEHSFKPRLRSGRSEAQNLADAVRAVAAFVHALPPVRR